MNKELLNLIDLTTILIWLIYVVDLGDVCASTNTLLYILICLIIIWLFGLAQGIQVRKRAGVQGRRKTAASTAPTAGTSPKGVHRRRPDSVALGASS